MDGRDASKFPLYRRIFRTVKFAICENSRDAVKIAATARYLPSTISQSVAGMVSSPVIAVPTSVGYGVSLGGLTALFAMLNSWIFWMIL